MLPMFAVGAGNLGWMLGLGTVMALEKNVSWGRRLSAPPLAWRCWPGVPPLPWGAPFSSVVPDRPGPGGGRRLNPGTPSGT